MSEAPQQPEGQPSLAERLRESRIGTRHDLVASRHVFRGEPAYILKDPLTFQTHHLELADYKVLRALRPETTLGETFAGLVEREELREDDEERFYAFVMSLHRRNLLQLPISDEKRLYERHAKAKQAKARRAWMQVFFFKTSLFNPDAMLSRTAHRVKPLFSRAAFGVWCVLVLAALVLAIQNASELIAPLSQVLLMQNLPLLWLTLIGLKVVHEYGHAYACKLLGGEVPEIGVNFIVGTPLPYVDASSAWGFTRKRDRLIVSAAGMYVELFLAAVALIVWSISEPGLVRAVAYNAAFLASVVTVGFNLNPLMKFDGYYLLSDALELPNLRQRSTQRTQAFFKRWLLGVPVPPRQGSVKMEAGLIGYGIACAIYKVTLVLGIATTIAMKFFTLGVLLAVAYVGSEAWRALSGLWKLLFRSEETDEVRTRAALLGALLLVAVPAGVVWVPVPSAVVSSAVVGAEHEYRARAEVGGFLQEAHFEAGDRVRAGALIATLERSEDPLALIATEGEYERARLMADGLRLSDPTGARREARRAEHLQEQVVWYSEQDERRHVLAQGGGRLAIAPRRAERGRWVQPGEPLATVTSGRVVARTYLDESQLVEVRPEPGQPVRFRAIAGGTRTYEGEVLSVHPEGTRRIDQPRLTQVGGGSIVIDPTTGESATPYFEVVIALDAAARDLPFGALGRVELAAETEPLGTVLHRNLLRFVQRLKK